MKNIITPPKLYQLSIVFMIIVHFIFPIDQIIHFPFTVAGIPVFVFGVWIAVKTKQLFKKTNTPIKPNDKPVRLRTCGTFRYSRNPMYLGITIGLLGIAILLGSTTPFIFPIIFLLIMNYVFISLEEEQLEKVLGEEFIQYKRKVRRWF